MITATCHAAGSIFDLHPLWARPLFTPRPPPSGFGRVRRRGIGEEDGGRDDPRESSESEQVEVLRFWCLLVESFVGQAS